MPPIFGGKSLVTSRCRVMTGQAGPAGLTCPAGWFRTRPSCQLGLHRGIVLVRLHGRGAGRRRPEPGRQPTRRGLADERIGIGSRAHR